MTKKILLQQSADSLTQEDWKALAARHNVTLVRSTADSTDAYVALMQELAGDLVAIVSTFPGVNAMGKKRMPDDVLRLVPKSLKLIAHVGAGYEIVGSLDILKDQGVLVSNTPEAVQQATADTALYLILGCLRDFRFLEYRLRSGGWCANVPLASEPDEKVLGILGMGGIGSLIRDKCASALTFKRIQYHSRTRRTPEVEKDTKWVPFLDLLATSDVLVVAVPLNASTHHMLNADSLAKCKPGMIIVNIARGPIIDESALVSTLETGHIKNVGLDVFENEPEVHPKLVDNPHVILLPHVGTHTVEARRRMQLQALENVDAFLSTGKVKNVVPELTSLVLK